MSAVSSIQTQLAQPIASLIEALRTIEILPRKTENIDYVNAMPPLLEALGWQADVRQLCDVLPAHAGKGLSRFDLLNCMAYLGYDYSKTTLKLEEIGPQMVPCLFEAVDPKTQQPLRLVVLEVTDRGWLCHDIVQGTSSLLSPKGLSGGMLFFSRYEEEDSAQRYARSKTGFTWFREIMERFTPLLWHVVLVGFLVNVMALAVPIFTMVTYDRVIGARSLDTLPYLTAGVLIAIVMEGVLRYIRLHSLGWMGTRINAIVSIAIYERLLFLSPAYTERASVPSQLSRLRAFEMVRDFFSGPIFLAILEVPFIIILMLAISMIAGPLVWIGVTVGTLYVLMLLGLHRQIKYTIHLAARSQSEKQQASVETFTKLEHLKHNGMADPMLDRFASSSARAAMAQFKSNFLAACIEHSSQALSMLAGVATLAFGVSMIWEGTLSIGALVATMILTWRMLSPLQTACATLPKLEHIRNSIEQINRLMAIRPECTTERMAQGFAPFTGQVVFSQVGLRYSRTSDPVFSNLNLAIAAGELVVVIGGNGSGKSSALKLIAGHYVPQSGTIRIDGTDIRQMDPVLLRRNISYVSQHPHLFTGSIIQNLRLSNPLATEAEIREAMIKADVWRDVDLLPGGMHHDIQPLDHHLPEGMLVRLELARLYLATTSLVLCDELPGAVINSKTGREFQRFIQSRKGKYTQLVVSHHRDMVAIADKVVWLQRERMPKTLTGAQAIALLEEEAW